MIEQIPLMLATPIAKAILNKFYEGVGNKLGEKAIDLLPEKVKQLGQLIWEKCLRGKPGADRLLQEAAKGSAEDQQKLTEYLNEVLESNYVLKQAVQKLADEIHLEIINSSNDMNQHNYGGTNFQTKVDGGVVNQANTITQNYYSASTSH
ncbi:hypothetical protein NIES2135_68120 (plasmid) [Leptolyngbya boryana NIES-2135]|jgi:hypothetical protein|uniref:Uncharacterized protein n=1 Tax=Leptolyngbya boryana NIES-2135 TaxID=1973484 RepID=A0A1Z4JT32_LEPBY|nr:MULTISPECIES: hypothetical protein [Leptolyngbya]BAY59935.1 hypothetical protein NIES2135_68120 [Leptolyngbya boryana NIES-2135]MBD2371513.1 hypothetical protein [Leptolyngbya sp. FACHB-161]MBD2378052.1 hypothetical protein [Leptolyngbya sp. FACHB-238]MBD2402497.1 hypothetical protein [Leptolyngbya sp. FACHB-239]MBD2408984.1 hypothetical protein [Leptolyngbya sp. FACHB-402]